MKTLIDVGELNKKLSRIIPALPADASAKTYVLKAVKGVLTWVEEA